MILELAAAVAGTSALGCFLRCRTWSELAGELWRRPAVFVALEARARARADRRRRRLLRWRRERPFGVAFDGGTTFDRDRELAPGQLLELDPNEVLVPLPAGGGIVASRERRGDLVNPGPLGIQPNDPVRLLSDGTIQSAVGTPGVTPGVHGRAVRIDLRPGEPFARVTWRRAGPDTSPPWGGLNNLGPPPMVREFVPGVPPPPRVGDRWLDLADGLVKQFDGEKWVALRWAPTRPGGRS